MSRPERSSEGGGEDLSELLAGGIAQEGVRHGFLEQRGADPAAMHAHAGKGAVV